MKIHNFLGDNLGIEQIWFNIVDGVNFGPTKVDKVFGSINTNEDVDVENKYVFQQDKTTKHVQEHICQSIFLIVGRSQILFYTNSLGSNFNNIVQYFYEICII